MSRRMRKPSFAKEACCSGVSVGAFIVKRLELEEGAEVEELWLVIVVEAISKYDKRLYLYPSISAERLRMKLFFHLANQS